MARFGPTTGRGARSTRAAACALFALTVAAGAAAESRPLREAIQVDATTTCLSSDGVAKAVAEWLERDAIDARISVRVKSEGDPLQSVSFVLQKGDEPSVYRQFLEPPADCSDLRAVVALSIALAIDHTLLETLGIEPPATRDLPTEPAPAPTPATPPAPKKPPPKQRRKAPSKPAPTLKLDAVLEAFATLRLLPEPTAGGLAGLDARWPSGVEVRLAAIASAPTDVNVGSGSAELQLAAARLDGCFRQALDGFDFRSCAGVAAGHVVAEGAGFDRDFGVALPWAAAIGRMDVIFPLGAGVSAGVGADGILALIRSEIRVIDATGKDVATRVMPAAGVGGVVGLHVALPQ